MVKPSTIPKGGSKLFQTWSEKGVETIFLFLFFIIFILQNTKIINIESLICFELKRGCPAPQNPLLDSSLNQQMTVFFILARGGGGRAQSLRKAMWEGSPPYKKGACLQKGWENRSFNSENNEKQICTTTLLLVYYYK